ncbi:hypothetical protein [Acaryochloris marina]|uniref:Bacterial conjugation TrbI-like protein n=1 Tax=Acaryochloris marina (strain MBIC 11017) TaxID=329726 RepID=A8ZNF1_ACAM1|nr:hypothetical protein [Acaryochloris marina]ABW32537.1 hypothetical protein AM1_D0040 [Acaryochloris marina MBIC11017]
MSTALNKWQDLTGDVDDPLDEIVEEADDDSDEDYSVVTKHTLATNPMIKLCIWGGGILVVLLGIFGIFLGVTANGGNTANNQQQQQQAAVPPNAQTGLSKSDQKIVEDLLERETFNRQQKRQQVLNGKKQQGKPKGNQRPASVSPQNTVSAPRVIYRARPIQQRSHASYQQDRNRQFLVQRPVAVQPIEQPIDDPNAGFFTAPVAASSSPARTGKRKLLKLSKSDEFKSNKSPIKRFTPPVQVASTAQTIPQPSKQFGNLSGNLQNPYMNQIVATASQAVIPVDTAISAQVVNRVSWIPENPGLAKGKVVRLKLQDDLKDGAGDVVASRGTIALGIVTQATEQGLISVNLTKIGSKFVQSGAVEIHQDGDPTMIAKLETKGGNNGFIKTALDIGIGGVQTWASNLNNPTSQTAISNGNQTFLSTNNNNRNNTAAFVEGATGRIGERLRQSVNGPTQTKIGVFRFGGKKVQLYFVREVRL